MATIASQALVILSLVCNIQFSYHRFVFKGGESGIQPSLGHVRLFRLGPVMDVNKRGLATYKTYSQEREERLVAKHTELEEKLYKLWKELGEIKMTLLISQLVIKKSSFDPRPYDLLH